jgi:phage baseplate assembly protein W
MTSSLDENESPFVGVGWSFPVGVNAVGGIALVRGIDEIEQAIHLILATSPGERPMRPEFGCGLIDFIFEPINPTTVAAIRRAVADAIDRWEPRVVIDTVDVHLDGDEPSRVFIEIVYTIRATYDQRSLVFPFYVIPEHA